MSEPTDPPDNGKVYTPAEMAATEAQMRAAREEAKGHRLEATAAKTAREAAEAALAAATNNHTAALSAADARFVRAELKAEAVKAGVIDAADALAMIPVDKITRDADGNPTNAAELLAALKEAKPYLFGAPATPKPSTSSHAPAPKPGDPVAKKATDMTDEEYRAARAAVTKR